MSRFPGSARGAWRSRCLGVWLSLAAGAAWPFELPFTDGPTGISCAYYDVQLGLKWHGGPAWLDADGAARGARAYARHTVEAGDTRRLQRMDVTPLVQDWLQQRRANDGLLVREASGALLEFHAREEPAAELRPQLLLQFKDGRRRFLEPVADATLDCSTYKGLGSVPVLRLANGTSLALRFQLPAGSEAAALQSAELILVRTDHRPVTARMSLAVYALTRPYGNRAPQALQGLAQAFSGDQGISAHPDVLFHDAMQGGAPDRRWRGATSTPASVVAADARNGFVPLNGQALRVVVPKGQQLGLDMRYRFRDHHPAEPEQIYFRYYLRLARSWLAAADGGKLPGLAGTYGRAGWGGRAWDGAAGWSLRGGVSTAVPPGHLAQGRVILSSYAYHAGAEGRYGESLLWADAALAGLMEVDRWVCIEQHVQLNTPGAADGVLQVWVDGQLAFSRNDLRLRDRAEIRIEEVWMNVFHGGTGAAPQDLHLYIDQVVVARRYIGPMGP